MIAVAALIIAPGLFMITSTDIAGNDVRSMVLFDMGNGDTEWYDAEDGTTYDEVLENTAEINNMKYVNDGIDSIILNDLKSIQIGDGAGTGNISTSGTTTVTTESHWTAYRWDATAKIWIKIPFTELNDPYEDEYLALSFYPDGYQPVETPDHPSAWTMVRGDAKQTGHQNDVTIPQYDAKVDWDESRDSMAGVYSSPLSAGGLTFVKYGSIGVFDPGLGKNVQVAAVRCYHLDGTLRWEFEYEGTPHYETATPVIVGDYIFIQTAGGQLFKINWFDGPEGGVVESTHIIPEVTKENMIGDTYGPGPGSMVYDSGALFFNSNNGMIYCFDLNLNLIWSRQMDGHAYYASPTVSGDYLFTGSRDGCLYVVNKADGTLVAPKLNIFTVKVGNEDHGSVSAPAVFQNDGKYTLMFSVSDGRGMNSTEGGVAVCLFDSSAAPNKILTLLSLNTVAYGRVGNYVLPVETDDFKGIYLATSNGIFKIDTKGQYKNINNDMRNIKAPLVLVNDEIIYFPSYNFGKPIYGMALDGKLAFEWTPDTKIRNYCMAPLLFINGMMFYSNDSGIIATSGTLPEYVPPPEDPGMALWKTTLIILAIIVLALLVTYLVLRYIKKIEKPFAYIGQRMHHYVGGDDLKHNTKSKHRLLIVMVVGIALTFIIFIISLCVGPTLTMSASEMFSSLFSAIRKGGQGLTYNELMVYESRLPRTLAALAVGIGLSIAGSMYQAVIRNPLVDPYIMGVSAGAGTAAVAVIAFDFTFFGLFSPHSIYLTAFAAIVGGIIAFFATMLIAEKAGGNSINYVLGGVVVGLAFSAIQTLLLSLAGQQVSNALSWLFGSFAQISWTQVGLIIFPAMALSLVPLIWAKEFNLVLLGEDQAQQMGLNVKRFNRIMLILASVLTAICVAFVGIIGFVGLVIPHLCRMILGGDHRLVLPASIAFGGMLMMIADLASRMLVPGMELPVGAITTMIGVPVFAYLLIKKGKMYDG